MALARPSGQLVREHRGVIVVTPIETLGAERHVVSSYNLFHRATWKYWLSPHVNTAYTIFSIKLLYI